MKHEDMVDVAVVSESALVCAAFCVTEEEVDQATRYTEGSAGGKAFYLVTDPQTLVDSRVDTLPSGEVVCTCGEPVDCLHRRAAMAANVLFGIESTEQHTIHALLGQGYTRDSATKHVYTGAPLVESQERAPESKQRVVYTGIKARTIAPIPPSHGETLDPA
jgi:hypothetical protein